MAFNLRTGQGGEYTLRTGLTAFDNVDANNITTGTLAVARLPSITKAKVSNTGTWVESEIPELSATKITSDELDAARVPDLSANKITTDALHVDRIPNLDASKIASGVFDALRIPTTDLMGVSQVGSTDDYMPAHLFRAPNMYSFIDSAGETNTTKTRLVFGCEDVVDSSSLQNPLLDATGYHKCVCVSIFHMGGVLHI